MQDEKRYPKIFLLTDGHSVRFSFGKTISVTELVEEKLTFVKTKDGAVNYREVSNFYCERKSLQSSEVVQMKIYSWYKISHTCIPFRRLSNGAGACGFREALNSPQAAAN